MSGAYELFRALGRVTKEAEEEDGKFTILFDADDDDHALIASSLGTGTQPEDGQTVRFSFTIKPDEFEATTEGGRRRSRLHKKTRRSQRKRGHTKRG
jgi:hypothetical protein